MSAEVSDMKGVALRLVALAGWLAFATGASAMPVAPVRGGDAVSSETDGAVLRPGDRATLTPVFDEQAGKETSTEAQPDPPGINIDRAKADYYGADFDNVIVVNKARDVQNMTVYRYQQLANGKRTNLAVRTFKVSTGQEVWRCESVLDKQRQPTDKREARWLGTPTGFFVPGQCEAVHTSNTYNDAKMRNACFFNDHLGIAIHKPDVREPDPSDPAPTKDRQTQYERAVAQALRPNQSHGCVRVAEADQIQQWVIESGPTPSGPYMQSYLAKAKKIIADPASSKRDVEEFSAKLQSSLKLVADATPNGIRDGAGPYSQATDVPDLNVKTGKQNYGPDGQAKRKLAPRTLIVVECINKKGQDCSTDAATLAAGKQALECNQTSKPEPVPQTVDPLSQFFNNMFGGAPAPRGR